MTHRAREADKHNEEKKGTWNWRRWWRKLYTSIDNENLGLKTTVTSTNRSSHNQLRQAMTTNLTSTETTVAIMEATTTWEFGFGHKVWARDRLNQMRNWGGKDLEIRMETWWNGQKRRERGTTSYTLVISCLCHVDKVRVQQGERMV